MRAISGRRIRREYYMKHNFKKIISLITVLCCLSGILLFSGCSVLNTGTALTVNGVSISDDVFAYYLDCATVELGASAPFKSLCDTASKYASTYFKTNTLAHSCGISLSTAEKASVSEKVGAYWSLYGEYYSKIGVTRETLTKIFTADAYKDALLLHYYGSGGENEIPVSRLYAQFRTNYIVFQAITGYFTETDSNGQSATLNANDSEAIILKFQNAAAMINAGEQNMEQAADFLAESGYQSSVQTVVLNKDDDSYPAGFFHKVQTTEARYATVIGTTDYIFLVLRGDADMNSEYFADKKTEMIKDIVGDEIDVKIESSLSVEYEIDDSIANGYYSLILNEKGE